MKLVEINGIKLEFDERTARTIESYKVGDKVKVLIKYYDSYKVHPGVIVGFSNFQMLPTIEVMYVITDSYESESFKFACINEKSTDVEICPFNELEALLDKQSIINKFDNNITKKENELQDMKIKREYFINRFSKAFENHDSA